MRQSRTLPWSRACAPADPVELADFGFVRGGIDRAGGKEERDLTKRMRGDMARRAHRRDRHQDRGCHDDVRELAHRRIGKPAL